jgi:hypothetical protein
MAMKSYYLEMMKNASLPSLSLADSGQDASRQPGKNGTAADG